jgi:isopenicillin-N epimerase
MVDEVEARVVRLTALTPFSAPEFRAPQMASLRVPRTDPQELQRRLLDEEGIEIPCFDWQDHTIVRLSVQGYNTGTDLDRLLTALTRILALRRAA